MEDQSQLEKLRQTLIKVAEASPAGSHIEVAERMKKSPSYIYKIRVGINAKVDNEGNRKLIQKAIDAYRTIIEREQKKYASL
ncbi:hypothetical protein [Mesonia aestuariivivens]|uniref:Helix-turn-helix domain-containing protein n=1 Tax=Mesonia aestuariivivens TaxID=2796128 RepID=A0ABS6W0E8_9FLAO|nr:hypothetical protein [Mesonia aestuariivivens]MBW2961305.1 hypothetical protein [Mesonia aestuariivivens]